MKEMLWVLSKLFSDLEQTANLLVQSKHHDMDINMNYIINDVKNESRLNNVKVVWKVDQKMKTNRF